MWWVYLAPQNIPRAMVSTLAPIISCIIRYLTADKICSFGLSDCRHYADSLSDCWQHHADSLSHCREYVVSLSDCRYTIWLQTTSFDALQTTSGWFSDCVQHHAYIHCLAANNIMIIHCLTADSIMLTHCRQQYADSLSDCRQQYAYSLSDYRLQYAYSLSDCRQQQYVYSLPDWYKVIQLPRLSILRSFVCLSQFLPIRHRGEWT